MDKPGLSEEAKALLAELSDSSRVAEGHGVSLDDLGCVGDREKRAAALGEIAVIGLVDVAVNMINGQDEIRCFLVEAASPTPRRRFLVNPSYVSGGSVGVIVWHAPPSEGRPGTITAMVDTEFVAVGAAIVARGYLELSLADGRHLEFKVICENL